MKIHLPSLLRRWLALGMGAAAFSLDVSPAATFMVEGVDYDNVLESTRFYDTGKGYYWLSFRKNLLSVYNKTGSFAFLGDLAPYIDDPSAGMTYDSFDTLSADASTCWRQASANLLQYWMSYYGVFYVGEKELPYGYTYSTDYLTTFGGTQSLKVAMTLFDNSIDTGGTLDSATDWFFRNVSDSWMVTEDGYMDGFEIYFGSARTEKFFTVKNLSGLTSQISTALGYDIATGKVTTKGQLAYLGINSDIGGHAITCYGFETDADGNVKALYICNSDDLVYGGEKVYLKMGSTTINGRTVTGPMLYKDEACTKLWNYASTSWVLQSVECINTQDSLKTMLAQYESGNLVWNGQKKVWASTDGYDPLRLPDASDGWQVEADKRGPYGVIGKQYYPSFFHPDRNVEFGDDAFSAGQSSLSVGIDGGVSASSVILGASAGKSYTFNGVNNASITTDVLLVSGGGSNKFSKVDLVVAGAVSVGDKGIFTLADSTLQTPSLTIASGSTLGLEGANTVSGGLVLCSGANVLATMQSGVPLLSSSGTLSIEGAVAVTISKNLARGKYIFGTFDSVSGKVDDLVVSGLSTEYEWLVNGGTLTLSVGVSKIVFPEAGGVWQDGVGGFENAAEQKVFFSGGTISIKGEVTPASISVEGAKDTVWNNGGNGTVSGTARLSKTGPGTLTINTSNSFSGGVEMNGGTLVAGHASAFGTGAVSLGSGTLDLGGKAVANAISATGGTISNADSYNGELTVAGTVSLSGATKAKGLTMTSGKLSGGSIAGTPITLSGGSVSSVITGTSSVTSTGTVTLGGENSYTGGTTVKGGTLTAGSAKAFGTGAVSLQGGTLNLGNYAFTNAITASGGKITNGSAYAGALTVNGAVTHSGTLSAKSVTMLGGKLSGGSVSGADVIVTGGSCTIDSYLAGSGSVTVKSGSLTLNGINDYTGGTVIDGGTLVMGGSFAFGEGEVLLKSGSLNLNRLDSPKAITATGGTISGADAYTGTLTVNGDVKLHLSIYEENLKIRNLKMQGGTLSGGDISGVSVMASGGTISTVLSGVSMVTSSGDVTLSGNNSYTRGTTVTGGTLTAGHANAFGTGRVTVQAGTLDLAGFYTSNSITMSGGTLTGASSYDGALTVGGDVSLKGVASPRTLTLNNGSISGGSLKDVTITAKKGDIVSDLTGYTSLTVKGDVSLYGNNVHSGYTKVSSGTLTVEGSISKSEILVAEGASLKVTGSVGGDVTLNGGSVVGDLSTAAGSTFTTTGESAVTGSLSLSGTWVGGAGSVLSVGGDLGVGSSAVLDFSAFEVADSPYTIAHVGGLATPLEGIAFTHGSGKRYSLSLSGSDLLLLVSQRDYLLAWQGSKGVWQDGGSTPWDVLEGAAEDSLFHNGIDVQFDSKATVTISGEVAPGEVSVAVSGKDALTLSGKGSIVGSGVLSMEGSGSLKLNAANSFSGGTVINAGTVSATGATSFGTGAITLNGGTLNLGGKAVANRITASGGTISSAAKFAGTLTVDGAVALNGNLLAKQVLLSGGTLTGGTIKDTAVTLESGALASAISGKSSVTVTGEASLTGKLSYTGGTVIDGGTLASGFSVAAKQSLAVTTGSIGGVLTLGGGSVLLLDGSLLSVESLKLSKASTLDVSALTASASISFGSLTGDAAKLLKLSAPSVGRRSYAMEIGIDSITVTASGDNTDLTWQGAKGKWEVAGSQEWTGTTDDNRFYHGDNVTFTSAATVTLTTKLAPGSVTVQGDGAVTFSGSGSITGGAALTMSGTNTLKLNATNTYTGGTAINSGTVIATGVDSFGTGDITLSGGTLNLSKKAVANSILVDGSATILNAKGFAGVITVQGGTLSLTDSLTGTLVLNGGTLDLSGVKNIAKLTFGNVICEAETEIVDAKGQHYAFVDGKLVPTDRTVAAVPVPQHAELPGAGLYTTMMRAQLDGNRAAFDSIRQLMGTGEPSSADGRYRFAAQATSASTDMKDYRRQGFGGLVMVEEVFSRKAVGGLSLNYEHADINPDGAGKYESDDTRVNAHLLVSTKNWQSRSIAGIGIHDYDVNHASATGHSFNLMEEISRTIAVDDKSVIAPFVRVETGYNVIGSINDGVLSIDKQTAWSTDVTLGARFVKTCDFGSVVLEAGVTKAIGDQGGAISASLVDDPATRAALSPSSRNRWSATLGGSVQIPVGTRSALHAGATLRLHGGTTEVNANVGYSIKF